MTISMLEFDEFASHVAGVLQIEPTDVTRDARLLEDLGLDSFDLVEAMALVEELGVRLPDDVALDVQTVGDLYGEYRVRAGG